MRTWPISRSGTNAVELERVLPYSESAIGLRVPSGTREIAKPLESVWARGLGQASSASRTTGDRGVSSSAQRGRSNSGVS